MNIERKGSMYYNLVEFLLSKRWISFVNLSFCWNRSLKIGTISMGKNSEIFISIVLEMSKKLSENALWIYFLIMFLRFKITIVFLHGLYIRISSFRSISDAIPPPPLANKFWPKERIWKCSLILLMKLLFKCYEKVVYVHLFPFNEF